MYPSCVPTSTPAQVKRAVLQYGAWLRTDATPGDRAQSLTMARAFAEHLAKEPRYGNAARGLAALADRYDAVERAVGAFERAAEHTPAQLGEAMRALRKERGLLTDGDRARVAPARDAFARRPALRCYAGVVDWLATPPADRGRQRPTRARDGGRGR